MEINPVDVLVRQRETIDRLIDNGMCVLIFTNESNGMRISENRQLGESTTDITKKSLDTRRLEAVAIQIGDYEFLVTKYDTLEMQIIEVGEISRNPNSVLWQKVDHGEANIPPSNLSAKTPRSLYVSAFSDSGCVILADSANQPELVTSRLESGLRWLQEKRKTQLANRTSTSQQFIDLIQGFLDKKE